jgi:hypothetical protein
MKTYNISLTVDEGWLEAINKLTDVDIYEGETLVWNSLEEINAN